jgi:hypothetical protein
MISLPGKVKAGNDMKNLVVVAAALGFLAKVLEGQGAPQ